MVRALFVFSAIVVAGCVTGSQIQEVGPGMQRSEVIAILGNPDGFQTEGDYEALKYSNRLMSGWSWDRTDYHVILKDGVVVEYGNGEVRSNGPNSTTLFLVPLGG